MCSVQSEPFRYSDDYRDAREEYARARSDMAEAKRSGAGFGPRWNAFKRSTFYWRLVSAFDEGIHQVALELHTRDGVLVQCTCGLLCPDRAELEHSDGHLDMTSWQVADVVILRVSKAADERFDAEPFVARCQRCGQRSPVHELGAAKYWRDSHRCEPATAPAIHQAAEADATTTGDRS